MRLAVSSSDTKQNCFQGVYYTRIGLIPAEVRSNWHKHESFDFIIDKAPHKLLKEIAENTLFFKNLSEATDVFISTAFNDNKKSTLEKGYFHAIFREPTDKKAVTEINIQSTGLSEETIFEKVKKIVEELPMYDVLKKNHPNEKMIILENKYSSTPTNIFFNI